MILLAVLKRLIGLFLSVISVDLRFRVDRRRICIFGLVVVMVWSVEVLMVFIWFLNLEVLILVYFRFLLSFILFCLRRNLSLVFLVLVSFLSLDFWKYYICVKIRIYIYIYNLFYCCLIIYNMYVICILKCIVLFILKDVELLFRL